MSESVSQRKRTSRNVSWATQTLLLISDHRHIVLGVGAVLVVLAVWAACRPAAAPTPIADDEVFPELDGFDAPPTTLVRTPDEPEPLVLPPAANEGDAAFDLGPTLAAARNESPAVSAAHFVDVPAPAVTSAPAWLTGSIETVDDAPASAPFQLNDASLRYTRPTRR